MENKNEISDSWKRVTEYLEQGISLIPVRDKADAKYPAKTPFFRWKTYQKVCITKDELFKQMEKFNTNATAFIGGEVSGNLEILDIDSKNWVGIDVMLFQQIKELQPEVWEKLRIHKTPSGGYHIIYKIEDHAPEGNLKLAFKEGAKEAAIETRGEGGYALTDSSLNYSVFQDRIIPTITWLERCSLKAICESFNQKKKIEAIKPRKEQNDFYDDNPFEDFNGKDGGAILAEYGWKPIKENNQFIWYTRPEKKTGISASFNKEKNVYFIFTSSTVFEPSKGYFPSMVLSKLQFNEDNKAVYQYLVDKGFGKVNKVKEARFAENKAKRHEALPNNFSEDAKAVYDSTLEMLAEFYPFGEFIKYSDGDRKMEVSRVDFYKVAGEMGFRMYDGEIVRIDGYVVSKWTQREFYDEMLAYIKSEDADEYTEFCNIFDKFIQKTWDYCLKRLPIFDEELILKDDRGSCYQFFSNGWLQITSQKKELREYKELENLVFAEKIIDRDWVESEDYGVYGDYMEKSVGVTDYVKSILGFLCHDFKNSATGFIPVLTEECENPEDGGGSGKNVWCNLLKNVTSFINKNCAGVKQDEKFFQIWTGQRILALSDLPENFNFGDIKEAATGSLLHKRLFKNEVEIPVEKSPKIVCQTNYSVENVDGGIKRRIRILEFSDFFTKAGGIDKHYNKYFPDDWTKTDWVGFHNLIADSIQVWLRNGLTINEPEITAGGWAKRFRQTYGVTINDIFEEYFDKWKREKRVGKDTFNQNLNTYYSDNNTSRKYQPSSIRINKALQEYCDYNGIAFKKDHQWSEANIKMRGRLFGIDEDAVTVNEIPYKEEQTDWEEKRPDIV